MYFFDVLARTFVSLVAKDDLLKFKRCEQEAKKEAILKKQMVSNHEDHGCKECKENFSSFIELMKHVPKQHNKRLDQGENNAKETIREVKEDFKKNHMVNYE